MFLRWKEAKYSQITIYHFLGRYMKITMLYIGYSLFENSRKNGCFL